MTKEKTLQSVTRAFRVLKAFSTDSQEYTLTELNQKLDISKSSLQRILHTLIKEGFLEKGENKSYKLGLELYFLGNLVEAHSSLITLSNHYLKKLNEETGETITLNIIKQNKRTCIKYIASKHELTMLSFISKESPLHAGASAKVLLAFLPKEERTKIINELDLKKLTEDTIIDKKILKEELEVIRKNNYSITRGERVAGVNAISAPVKNRHNNVIASVTITIPDIRMKDSKKEEFIRLLHECTEGIYNNL